MTASFKKEGKLGPKKVVQPRHHFSLQYLYQVKKVNGHVFVLVVSRLHVSMIFLLKFGDLPTVWCFIFHFIITIDSNKQINIILQLTL